MTDENRSPELLAKALLHVVTSLIVEMDRKHLIDLADLVATVQKTGVSHRARGEMEIAAAMHVLSLHLLGAVA